MEKTKFEKNGIPTINNGHMAAPALLFRTEYGIFKKDKERVINNKKKKWKTVFKGAF